MKNNSIPETENASDDNLIEMDIMGFKVSDLFAGNTTTVVYCLFYIHQVSSVKGSNGTKLLI